MPDLLTRLHELESIVEHHERARIPDLVDMLSPRPSPLLDEAVCWALGRLCERDEIPLLESLLVKSLYAGVAHLGQALIRLGDREDHRRLVDMLLDRNLSIDKTLGGYHLRFPELVPLVEPYCESGNWRVRSEARNFVDRQRKPAPAVATPRQVAGEPGQRARTGDPAAIDSLLASLDTLGERDGAAVDLEVLLQRSAGGLPTDALETLTGQPTWILDCWHYEHEFGFSEGVLPVDLSRVKQLAAQELQQRKEQT
jgi:hypothetical protein